MTGGVASDLRAARVRVRTPGKHIVMFLTAATVIVAAAFNILRASSADTALTTAGRPAAAAPGADGAVALGEFLVDLSRDRDGRTAYLKLSAAVSVDGGAGVARVEEARAEIRERVTFLLRGLSADDFEGDDAMARIKAELRRRVDLAIAPAVARDVVITDLVIQ